MFSSTVHRYIFLFGIMTVLVGLSLGAIFISFGTIIVSANWFLEGNFLNKFNKLKSSGLLWIFLCFYLLHVLAMLWTEDKSYGGNDLKIKLPLLAFPIVFCTTEKLTVSEFRKTLVIYVSGILLATLWSMLFYLDLKKADLNDIRGISRFFSHIRFSMNVVFGIFISIWLFYTSSKQVEKILFILLTLWLIIFLFILSSLTGIVLFIIISLICSIYFSFRQKNNLIKAACLILITTTLAVPTIFLVKTYRYFFPVAENEKIKLETWTPAGDLYYHDKDMSRENGYFVWKHISYPELEKSWNRKSKFNFDGEDSKGNFLKFTLIRYMASKGLKKDSLGFTKLVPEDIRNIEQGFPNYKLVKASSLEKRMYEVMWELDDFYANGHVKNHSIMVRALYWKTAWEIIKENPIFGVGTGDIQSAFEARYQRGDILSKKEDMRRSHNQFLEIWAALGIIGILSLLLICLYPFLNFTSLHPLSFLISLILFLSMFTEDTLETQAGVTLFAFFIPFFSFMVQSDSSAEITS